MTFLGRIILRLTASGTWRPKTVGAVWKELGVYALVTLLPLAGWIVLFLLAPKWIAWIVLGGAVLAWLISRSIHLALDELK